MSDTTRPAEMTIGQLHDKLGELLATRHDAFKWKLRIPMHRGRPGLGGRSATGVSTLSVGFDHDASRLFLEPVEPLGLGDEALKSLGKRSESQAGLIYMLNREAEKAKAAGKDTELAERIMKMIATMPGGMPPRVAVPASA